MSADAAHDVGRWGAQFFRSEKGRPDVQILAYGLSAHALRQHQIRPIRWVETLSGVIYLVLEGTDGMTHSHPVTRVMLIGEDYDQCSRN